MENFFAGSKYALYFIGLFFIIIQNRSNKIEKTDKNIILIYIIYALTNIFNIINILPSTIVVFSICLIETQVLTLNEAESILLIKTRYKIVDYIFTMVNKYKAVQIIILNILFSLFLNEFECNSILAVILLILQSGVFLSYISKIYLNTFRVKRLDEVEKEFIKLSKGFHMSNQNDDLDIKIQMLTEIEDKTFLIRENSYTSISFESLMYKINKSDSQIQKTYEIKTLKTLDKVKYIKKNFFKIVKLAVKILEIMVKAIIFKNGIKKFIKRGYSTIEMQLMRQLAIETGYQKVYRRKIYEFLYTHMFFRSLDQKRKYNNYQEHIQTYKKRIAYVYFKKVPTYLNTGKAYKRCDDIYDFYRSIRTEKEFNQEEITPEKIVYSLTLEETFIFILGLSGKKLYDEMLEKYTNYLEKFELNINTIKEIILKINYLNELKLYNDVEKNYNKK